MCPLIDIKSIFSSFTSRGILPTACAASVWKKTLFLRQSAPIKESKKDHFTTREKLILKLGQTFTIFSYILICLQSNHCILSRLLRAVSFTYYTIRIALIHLLAISLLTGCTSCIKLTKLAVVCPMAELVKAVCDIISGIHVDPCLSLAWLWAKINDIWFC